MVPSVVLVECLYGDSARDARTNLLLRSCDISASFPLALVRRAAQLRAAARTGSAVDALVVAMAEPDGLILTGDVRDIAALASHADRVSFERI